VITSEVNEIYLEVLGRAPDSGGLNTYSTLLASGTPLASIRQGIAGSPEAAGDINQLYLRILGRGVDSSGLGTYSALVGNGSSLFTTAGIGGSIALILAQSNEAQGDLNQIYQDVLARNADGSGLASYTAALGGGTPLNGTGGVRGIIAHSPEAQGDLTSLFQGILGRAPGAAELVGMEDQLSNPGTTQSSLNGALTSTGSAGGYTTVPAASAVTSYTAQPQVPTLFDFTNLTFGNDTIAGFDPTRDTITLPHAVVTDLATLNNETTTTAAGSTLIALNPSQSITITGVAKGSLDFATASNFRIV
jgi:hypothetical protein